MTSTSGTGPMIGRPRRVWRLVGTIDRAVIRLESIAAASLVLGVVVAVLLQVIMRYLFERPNPWTEELSRYFFIWLSLIGSSLAAKRGAHFLFDTVVAGLHPTARRIVRSAVTGLVVLMLAGLLIVGVRLAGYARHQRSPALDLPMVWVYAALPVAAALMLLHICAGVGAQKEGEPGWASR